MVCGILRSDSHSQPEVIRGSNDPKTVWNPQFQFSGALGDLPSERSIEQYFLSVSYVHVLDN